MSLLNKLGFRSKTSNEYIKIPTWPEPPTSQDPAQLQEQVDAFPYWYQRIYLGNGVYTLPNKAFHEGVWSKLLTAYPANLNGASVLDIGCNAGYFSIQHKLLGAGRVVGIESIEDYQKQAELCRQVWDMDIEYLPMDAHEAGNLNEQFDIVVFTGILYHLKNPLQVLEIVGSVCQDAILIETEVMIENGRNQVYVRQGPWEKLAVTKCSSGFMKFIESDELNGDGSNWWIPDTACLLAMLRTAGFKYFSTPCYHFQGRILLIASKKQDSVLNLQAI